MDAIVYKDSAGKIDAIGSAGAPDLAAIPPGADYKIVDAATVNQAVGRYFDAFDFDSASPIGATVNIARARALHWGFMAAARTTATAAATVADDQPRLTALAALAESDLAGITDFDALRSFWPESLGPRINP